MNLDNPLVQTVLRMVSEADRGGQPPALGLFRCADDIIDELGDESSVLNVLDNLARAGLIREVSEKFEALNGHSLGYSAYQITELGKTHTKGFGAQNIFGRQTKESNSTQLIIRLDQLIQNADLVLRTHTPNPPNVIGFPTLNDEQFQQWKASSENIIISLCGPNSGYLENFKKEVKKGYKSNVNAGKGILKAIKEDVEAGVGGPAVSRKQTADVSVASVMSDTVSLRISKDVYSHIQPYLENEDYFHAVEESYKVVREKLLSITGKEKASDIFNLNAESQRYHQVLFGRTAETGSPDSDFLRGIGYLNLTIQFLRNEKSHTLATDIDKNLAIHYVSLASLAYDLISRNKK